MRSCARCPIALNHMARSQVDAVEFATLRKRGRRYSRFREIRTQLTKPMPSRCASIFGALSRKMDEISAGGHGSGGACANGGAD